MSDTSVSVPIATFARQVAAYLNFTTGGAGLQNPRTITSPYVVPANYNAALVGPITLGEGGSITIGAGGSLKFI